MTNSNITMIDISEKVDVLRIAKAEGKIFLKKSTIQLIKEKKLKKEMYFQMQNWLLLMQLKKLLILSF